MRNPILNTGILPQNLAPLVYHHNMRGKLHKCANIFLKDFIYLFIFRERGKEGEREGEKHQSVASGAHPDLESNCDLSLCGMTPNQPNHACWGDDSVLRCPSLVGHTPGSRSFQGVTSCSFGTSETLLQFFPSWSCHRCVPALAF